MGDLEQRGRDGGSGSGRVVEAGRLSARSGREPAGHDQCDQHVPSAHQARARTRHQHCKHPRPIQHARMYPLQHFQVWCGSIF